MQKKTEKEEDKIGFVLINTLPGQKDEVCKQLSKEEMVVEVNPLDGEYDIIVKIKGNSYDEIGEFAIRKIRTIKEVIDTKTLIRALTGDNEYKKFINSKYI